MDDEKQLKIDIELPFPSSRLAQIAYDVLRVDAEPKRSGVIKELNVNENKLIAKFKAQFARQLRVAVNGFLEKVDLISETVDYFGAPVSDSYNFF